MLGVNNTYGENSGFFNTSLYKLDTGIFSFDLTYRFDSPAAVLRGCLSGLNLEIDSRIAYRKQLIAHRDGKSGCKCCVRLLCTTSSGNESLSAPHES